LLYNRKPYKGVSTASDKREEPKRRHTGNRAEKKEI
jgi:hypothetical protein